MQVHKDWLRRRFQDGNDVALIRLDKPLVFLVVKL